MAFAKHQGYLSTKTLRVGFVCCAIFIAIIHVSVPPLPGDFEQVEIERQRIQGPVANQTTLAACASIARNHPQGFNYNSLQDTDCLPELRRQDNAEFEEWENGDELSLKLVQETWEKSIQSPNRNLHRYVISNNTIFHSNVFNKTFHEQFAILLMKAVIFSIGHGNPLPDLDLIWNPGDVCASERGKQNYPIWSWAIDISRCNDFFAPYWSFLWMEKQQTENIPNWEDRIPKLVFRGSNTGQPVDGTGRWQQKPRAILATMCQEEIPDFCDAGFYHVFGDDRLRQEMMPLMKKRINRTEELRYRFQILLNGNGPPSSRSLRLLGSGGLNFKPEMPDSEFWYPLLQPYVNYVPLADNLSDLKHRLEWAKENDAQSERIAKNGMMTFEYLTDQRVTCWFAGKLRRYAQNAGTENILIEPRPGMTRVGLTASQQKYICNYVVNTQLGNNETCWQIVGKHGPI